MRCGCYTGWLVVLFFSFSCHRQSDSKSRFCIVQRDTRTKCTSSEPSVLPVALLEILPPTNTPFLLICPTLHVPPKLPSVLQVALLEILPPTIHPFLLLCPKLHAPPKLGCSRKWAIWWATQCPWYVEIIREPFLFFQTFRGVPISDLRVCLWKLCP